MNKETFEALKKIMHHCEYGGQNDKEFCDDFKLVESWIEEQKNLCEEAGCMYQHPHEEKCQWHD